MGPHDAVEALDQHLDRSLDRFQSAIAPLWENQTHLGRSVVTLASSALVLSISVFQLPQTEQTPQVVWAPLLFTAWCLFALAILLGAARYGWAAKGQTFRIKLELDRGTIRNKVAALDWSSPDITEQIDSALEEWTRPAWDESKKAIDVHDALIGIMYFSFAFGLVALLVFAVANFQ